MKHKLENRRNVYRNKTVRRHLCDVFNTLSASLKINRVTKKVYFEYCRRLKRIIRKWVKTKTAFAHNKNTYVIKLWGRNLPRTPLKLLPRGRRPKNQSFLGHALKRRRRLALYLHGGRVRSHQYRAITKRGSLFHDLIATAYPASTRIQEILSHKKNTSNMGVESRTDALLVRTHFCKTVFQAVNGSNMVK